MILEKERLPKGLVASSIHKHNNHTWDSGQFNGKQLIDLILSTQDDLAVAIKNLNYEEGTWGSMVCGERVRIFNSPFYICLDMIAGQLKAIDHFRWHIYHDWKGPNSPISSMACHIQQMDNGFFDYLWETRDLDLKPGAVVTTTREWEYSPDIDDYIKNVKAQGVIVQKLFETEDNQTIWASIINGKKELLSSKCR